MKLGLLANEFFDLSTGRMGGFGWATRQVANCFNNDKSLDVEVVFIAGESYGKPNEPDPIIHNTRVILRQKNFWDYARRLWSEKFDLILTIDYRPEYRRQFFLLPKTPIITWVRDPRTDEDALRIKSVRLPGQETIYPKGLESFDCTSLVSAYQFSERFNRPFLFASTCNFLTYKIKGTYGVQPPQSYLLPNIIDLDPGQIKKTQQPTVVFLARLDPYKRPWLFVELARHFLEVTFIILGKAHFEGKGAWKPTSLPNNVKLMGHIGGTEKVKLLSEAWVLINTSIHEGLAVSFLEALKCETPILSCVDPENVVSRFGVYVGRWEGTGETAIPYFIEGLNRLLTQHQWRIELGQKGKQWVTQTHNKEQFIASFNQLCKLVKVK